MFRWCLATNSRRRIQKLSSIRRLLKVASPAINETAESQGDEPTVCPHCHVVLLWTVLRTRRPRVAGLVAEAYQPKPFDTS